MSTHRKILDQNGLNFLTFTVVDWISLFIRPVFSDIIINSLRFCQEEKQLLLFAYVLMPNHLHLIVRTDQKAGLSGFVHDFKSFTAKEILKKIQDYEEVESRRKWLLHHFAFHAKKNHSHGDYQVWEKGSHPVNLYTPKVIRQKIAYIHNNPLRANLVVQPEHYLYSSASNYIHGKGVLDVVLLEDIWNDEGFVLM